MRKSSVTTTALAAFAVNLAILATAFDGSAQEATQLRRLPAQLAPAQIEPVKPSRPQPLHVERGPVGPGKLATGNAAGGSTPSQLANLVVVPYYNNASGLPEGFPTHSYCLKNPAGGTPTNIRFYIRNLGGSASGGFQWTPSFPNAGAAPAHVLPSIPANGQVMITQPIPQGCYTPGFSGICQFSIHLDDHDEVEESSEANTWQSHCVSPAG